MEDRGIYQRHILINATWVALLTVWLAVPLRAHGDDGTVEHIVIVWLKEPGNHAARKRVLENSQRLGAIPGVLSIKSGRAIPGNRPVVDSSFDVALVITLADAAAMQDYLTHPIHI